MSDIYIDNIMAGICSKQKLERDKSLSGLVSSFSQLEQSLVDRLYSAFISGLNMDDRDWESYQGILAALKALLSCSAVSLDCDLEQVCAISTHLLMHDEVRVRQAAGEMLGTLCSKDNGQTYLSTKAKVFELIQMNMNRNLLNGEGSMEDPNELGKAVEKLTTKPTFERRLSNDSNKIFHDTAGWRNLETSMKCLENMIIGCGATFSSYMDQELLEMIFSSLTHANRFVRETGFSVCGAIVSCQSADGEDVQSTNYLLICGDKMALHLGNGLADNWSQVRFAASVSSRKFLLSLPVAARERFYPYLLPRICLNRYYVAEGVRLYSQETWRLVTGADGKLLVEKYINDVVPYYIESTEADNHAVREAACSCIAELALKISHEAVQPYVTKLLVSLTVCFNDESWPVRDAACLACGNFISCFPDESKDQMQNLFPLFFNNLQDNIPSVRQGAALALSTIVKSYGQESLDRVVQWMEDAIKGVEKQSSDTDKYGDLETGPATFGVVKRKRDNDVDLHSNKQMYSCGSLAPKMMRGGCSDCRFKRPTQEWEKADGAIHLAGNLSSITVSHDILRRKIIPEIAECLRLKHYTSHISLHETLCKVLPIIGKGLGKRAFKDQLHLFLEPVFYSLSSGNALSSSAASQCLNQIGQMLGPAIFRGRVEQHNPEYLKALDANTSIGLF